MHRYGPLFSTFMDKAVNRRGEFLVHNHVMKKGRFRRDRLREAMLVRGIQRNADLARFLKVNPQTSHKWHPDTIGGTRNISAGDLFHIADKLDVNARWLMDLSETKARGKTLSPDQQAVLALYDELSKIDGDWAQDWVSEGNRLLKKLGRQSSVGNPFPGGKITSE